MRAVERNLAFGIEVRIRLIQHDKPRQPEHRTRQRDALPLAAGERQTARPDARVEAVRQFLDQIDHTGEFRRQRRLLRCRRSDRAARYSAQSCLGSSSTSCGR